MLSRTVAAACALALSSTVLAGCFASKETREGAERLDKALGTPSWADDVKVESGVSGLSTDEVLTTVVIEPEATPEQVGQFIYDFIPIADEAGLGASYDLEKLRIERTDGTALDLYWEGPVELATAVDGVARWQKVADLFDTQVFSTLATEGANSYWVSLGEDANVMAVADGFDDVREGELSGPLDSWTISSLHDGMNLYVADQALPTAEEITAFRELVDAAPKVSGGFSAKGVTLSIGADYIAAGYTVLAPTGVTEENFLPATYGDDLLPAIEGQLDVVKGLEGDWSYQADWATAEIPDSTRFFVSLLKDEPPTDNGDYATAWSTLAYDHVQGK